VPEHTSAIRVVTSFDALIATPFRAGCNAICWQRQLVGDFDEVVRLLDADDDITTVDEALLGSLCGSPAGRAAIAILLQDLGLLRAIGHAPNLDCIRSYPRDTGPVPTDVHSFHVDSATVATDTFLCSYTAPASEGLHHHEARRRIDDPATRAALLAAFGGRDDEAFRSHLAENCFDLHYEPLPGARPFSFGVGNLWRIAVQYPGSPVPPCIHRAPTTAPGQPPRLLLIS
jgi:hypothetical protein